jgi:predicted transposase/invertase (TIGR01784 family)
MLDFLNAVLTHVGEEPISEILEMKSEYTLMGNLAEQKYSRLDVRVKAKSGRLFDVEVQLENDNMNTRGLFYGTRLMEEELSSGASYNEMPDVRVINIVDFYVRDDKEHVIEPVVFCYKNCPGQIATDKFMMYHIQLPVFRKQHPSLESVVGDSLSRWLYMLDQAYKNEEEMKMLSEMSEGLKNFAIRYNIALDDPDLLRYYRMIEDGKRDIRSQIQSAEKRGWDGGKAEGRAEGINLGKDIGLRALVHSMKPIYNDFDSVCMKVRENDDYADVSTEDILKYYNEWHP